MSITQASLDLGYTAVASTVTHVSLHTANPGTSGASEVVGGTYTRQAATYGAPTAGAGGIGAPATFQIPAGVTITHWGAWAGSVFRFGAALAEPKEFLAAGAYTLVDTPFAAVEDA